MDLAQNRCFFNLFASLPEKIAQNKGFWGPLGGLLWASGIFWAFCGLLGLFPAFSGPRGFFKAFLGLGLFLGLLWPSLNFFEASGPLPSLFWASCELFSTLPAFFGPRGLFLGLFVPCGFLGLFLAFSVLFLGFQTFSQPFLSFGVSSRPRFLGFF